MLAWHSTITGSLLVAGAHMGMAGGFPPLAPLPKSPAEVKAGMKSAYWELLREQKVLPLPSLPVVPFAAPMSKRCYAQCYSIISTRSTRNNEHVRVVPCWGSCALDYIFQTTSGLRLTAQRRN